MDRTGCSEPPLNVRRPLGSSLTFRLSFFAATLVVAALLGAGWVGYRTARTTLEKQIESELRVLVAERQSRLQMFVEMQFERVELIASRTRLREVFAEYRAEHVGREVFRDVSSRILRDALLGSDDFREIVMADREGRIVSGTSEEKMGTQFPIAETRQFSQPRPWISDPKIVNGVLRCLTSAPLMSQQDEQLGFVVIDVNAEALREILEDEFSPRMPCRIHVAQLQGSGLRSLIPGAQTSPISPDDFPAMQRAINGESGFGQSYVLDEPVLAVWTPIDFQPGDASARGLVALFNAEAAYAPVREFRDQLILLLGGLLAIALSITYVGGRRLTKPLRLLTGAVNAMSAGRAIPQIPVRRNDEVGQLAATFNSMARRLDDTYGKLQRRAEELEHANARLEGQLEMARDFQQYLYPQQAPVVPGYDFAGMTLPADRLCGDYFDFVPLTNETIAVAVGDVSGHGAGPALLMVETRAVIHDLAEDGVPLERWAERLNSLLFADSPDGRFVSLFVGELDPALRRLRFLGAGHNAWLLRPDGSHREFPSTGLLLGLTSDAHMHVQESELKQGDIVLLATDGLQETWNRQRELFGVKRVLENVTRNRQQPAAEILASLYDEVGRFRDGKPQLDDLTAVLVKVL